MCFSDWARPTLANETKDGRWHSWMEALCVSVQCATHSFYQEPAWPLLSHFLPAWALKKGRKEQTFQPKVNIPHEYSMVKFKTGEILGSSPVRPSLYTK